MKNLFFSVLFVVLCNNLFAQDSPLDLPKKNLNNAIFFQDFVNFASDKPGLSRVDIFIQVPYKNVQFVKSKQGFTAKYSVTASIFDSSMKKLIVEKTWNETIDVMDYTIATSKDNYNLSKRSFDLTPGSYFIKTKLEDKDSRKEAFGESVITIKNFKDKISVSDILLITKSEKSDVVPNVSRNIPVSKDRVKFYFEVYNQDSIAKNISFDYSILNSDLKSIHKEIEDRNLKPGINKVLFTMQEFPFDLGTYMLSVSALDSNQKNISNSTKAFYSHQKGLPVDIVDIDKAISQTVYIATPDELDFMENGKDKEDKTKKFLEFWKKKDPSPNNEENEIFDEYFRRVAFANENFSNYLEGWRSDRGMVSIILGAPNNIDRHPFEYDSKPYEVWEYYDLNRSFVFLDQTGFGDYRLITPLTGDLYRYRY
jgi:GWxTD domain-containing protein